MPYDDVALAAKPPKMGDTRKYHKEGPVYGRMPYDDVAPAAKPPKMGDTRKYHKEGPV